MEFWSHLSDIFFMIMIVPVNVSYLIRNKSKHSGNKNQKDNMLSKMKPLEGVWQPVNGTRQQFYVYSAYLDCRRVNDEVVRVIAATAREEVDTVFCLLQLQDNTSHILNATVKITPNHNYEKYSAATVLCALGTVRADLVVGGVVSIVAFPVLETPLETPPTNALKLIHIAPNSKKTMAPSDHGLLHVCVRPISYYYNNVDWLVEWIELNRLLGVSHFYLYNMSVGDRVACALNYYKTIKLYSKFNETNSVQNNLITMLPWQLPLNVRNQGQLAAINDCLYRSMSAADWLMVIDLDEVVLPHKASASSLAPPTLQSLLNSMSGRSFQPDSFIFRNAFFYMDWKDDLKSTVPLMTSRKTRRLERLNEYYKRSKYIVQPNNIETLDIHLVNDYSHGVNSYEVGSEEGLLHHYRNKCVEKECLDLPSTVDRTAHKWAKLLWKRVSNKFNRIGRFCRWKK